MAWHPFTLPRTASATWSARHVQFQRVDRIEQVDDVFEDGVDFHADVLRSIPRPSGQPCDGFCGITRSADGTGNAVVARSVCLDIGQDADLVGSIPSLSSPVLGTRSDRSGH